jgi:hypothetical protein
MVNSSFIAPFAGSREPALLAPQRGEQLEGRGTASHPLLGRPRPYWQRMAHSQTNGVYRPNTRILGDHLVLCPALVWDLLDTVPCCGGDSSRLWGRPGPGAFPNLYCVEACMESVAAETDARAARPAATSARGAGPTECMTSEVGTSP